MGMAAKIKRAQEDGTKYVIFWSPGCPYSEEAKKLGLKIRSKGAKVRIIKVSHIANRKEIGRDAMEMASVIPQTTAQYGVSWPQIFKLSKNKVEHLSGGYEEFSRTV